MTTIQTHPDDSVAAGSARDAAAASIFTGAAEWVTSTDHKRIGRLYTGFGLLVLLATAVVALLLGIARADDSSEFIDASALLQLFQMYRVGLVVGGVAPLAIGLAVAVTPLQLGARSIAFPRVALTGFYTWLGGTTLVFVALGANGGAGGGDADMVDLFLAGLGLASFGLCATALSVATSVLTTRAPGMTMRRVPLFAWSSLISALGMLLVLPILVGIVIYLFVDHRLGSQGNFMGVEGIGAWIGWAFTVPAVIVFALPALGVAAELVPVTFRHRSVMRGTALAGLGLVGVASYAAATQQLVQDVTFDTDGETFVRGLAPMLILAGLPLLGVTVVLLSSMLTVKSGAAGGAPSIRAPFVFGLFGLLVVGAGIAANFVQGITDLELVDTVSGLSSTFEEGATLLVVYGTAIGVMGGLVFWSPKLWGRLVADKLVMPLALLAVAGALLAAVPLLIAGFLDQVSGYPASQADIDLIMSTDQVDGGAIWITLSLIGHGVMALSLLAFGGLLLKVCTGDADALDDNPYGGHTIEWGTTSPAPAHNFDHVATVASAEPRLVARIDETATADTTQEGSPS
jgi:heme/copper-type cytochrome/quinol oxidase subunit 1